MLNNRLSSHMKQDFTDNLFMNTKVIRNPIFSDFDYQQDWNKPRFQDTLD